MHVFASQRMFFQSQYNAAMMQAATVLQGPVPPQIRECLACRVLALYIISDA